MCNEGIMYVEVNPQKFKDALTSVSQLVDEALLEISNTGIETSAVDPANVGMVEMEMTTDSFLQLDTNNETLAVKVNELEKAVTRLQDELVEDSENRTLHMTIDEEKHRLQVWCEPGTMEFSISLLDPDSVREQPDIPDIDLASTVKLKGEYFAHVIQSARKSGFEHITVGTADDAVTFICEGDIDDFTVEADETDFGVHSVDGGGVDSIYSIDYFNDIRKGLPDEQQVTIGVGNDFPISISAENEDGDVSVSYDVAPRVEDE
jgi:proliferating cell nuclear antigen